MGTYMNTNKGRYGTINFYPEVDAIEWEIFKLREIEFFDVFEIQLRHIRAIFDQGAWGITCFWQNQYIIKYRCMNFLLFSLLRIWSWISTRIGSFYSIFWSGSTHRTIFPIYGSFITPRYTFFAKMDRIFRSFAWIGCLTGHGSHGLCKKIWGQMKVIDFRLFRLHNSSACPAEVLL